MKIKKLKTKLIIQSARHIIQKCWLTVFAQSNGLRV